VRLCTPSVFAYEGTIDDAHALQTSLDPTWAATTALRTPGDLIFAHVFSCMADIGALYASDVALALATREFGAQEGSAQLRFFIVTATICTRTRLAYRWCL
jgi:hypothetical protein